MMNTRYISTFSLKPVTNLNNVKKIIHVCNNVLGIGVKMRITVDFTSILRNTKENGRSRDYKLLPICVHVTLWFEVSTSPVSS